MTAAPLILTLNLNETAFQFFDSLRQQHFPPARNYLKAHLTLFHHLPPGEATIEDTLMTITGKQKVIDLQVTGVVSIGKGVAYTISSDALVKLHRQLQQQWAPWLIPQDRQKLWPHVTVQNKVAPATAQQLQKALAQNFTPFTAKGTGFSLWTYLNGPWGLSKVFHFDNGW